MLPEHLAGLPFCDLVEWLYRTSNFVLIGASLTNPPISLHGDTAFPDLSQTPCNDSNIRHSLHARHGYRMQALRPPGCCSYNALAEHAHASAAVHPLTARYHLQWALVLVQQMTSRCGTPIAKHSELDANACLASFVRQSSHSEILRYRR